MAAPGRGPRGHERVKRAERRMRAGVVGAGHMGQYHILVYAELWDVDLVGLVDTDASKVARLAAQYDTQGSTDYRELFGKVDVVSIAVPTPLHFQVARDFMEAGISVLVEKPLTPTLEEARQLFRLARERNVVLHVGHVERFNGAVQELRKIVVNPILVESRRLGPFVPRVQHDTVVMDLMIHDIDIVLGLVDAEIRRVIAAGSSVHSAQADVANVQIVFENGTIANITASRATEQKIRTLAITQPDAYIFLNYTDQDIQIHRRAASEYILNRESIRYRQESFVEHLFVHKENPLKLEILHLLSAVRESQRIGRADASGHDDVRSLSVALAVESMIREGRPSIDWPPR
jgi:predicted dehydrogenase